MSLSSTLQEFLDTQLPHGWTGAEVEVEFNRVERGEQVHDLLRRFSIPVRRTARGIGLHLRPEILATLMGALRPVGGDGGRWVLRSVQHADAEQLEKWRERGTGEFERTGVQILAPQRQIDGRWSVAVA